jgi:hypothetical protein
MADVTGTMLQTRGKFNGNRNGREAAARAETGEQKLTKGGLSEKVGRV